MYSKTSYIRTKARDPTLTLHIALGKHLKGSHEDTATHRSTGIFLVRQHEEIQFLGALAAALLESSPKHCNAKGQQPGRFYQRSGWLLFKDNQICHMVLWVYQIFYECFKTLSSALFLLKYIKVGFVRIAVNYAQHMIPLVIILPPSSKQNKTKQNAILVNFTAHCLINTITNHIYGY